MAAREGEKAVVVSNDRVVTGGAAARGAAVIASGEFEKKLLMAEMGESGCAAIKGPSSPGKPGNTRKKGPARKAPKSRRRNRRKTGKL